MLCSLRESRAVTHRRIRSAGRLPANPQPPLELAPPDGAIAARVEGLHPGDVGRNPAVESAQALQKEVGKAVRADGGAADKRPELR